MMPVKTSQSIVVEICGNLFVVNGEGCDSVSEMLERVRDLA